MKIAITGASGYVGRFVAETLSRNFDVIGLARQTNQVTKDLKQIKWRLGDLNDSGYLTRSIKDVDLIIHCAMSYTLDGNEDYDLDKKIVDTLLAENKRVIYTGSLFGVKDGELQSEDLQPDGLYWRFEQEKRILNAGGDVIRLGFVYGGNAGYFWEIVKPDANNKVYVTGQREFVWPMIHIYDLANLYLKIATRGNNQIFHAWDGYKTPYFEMFELISSVTGCKIVAQKFGYASKFMQATTRVNNCNAVELGWTVQQGDLFSNLNRIIPKKWKAN